MTEVQISKFVVTQRSCSKGPTGLRMSGNNSFVHLEFPSSESRILEFHRLRGADAKVIINNEVFVLKPNGVAQIEIKASSIKIKRDNRAKGHIILSKVKEKSKKPEEKKSPSPNNYVQDFLKKVKYKGIKASDSGVFAGEYAEIEKESQITDLLTDPPNAWIRKNGKIVFIHPCRIFDVCMDGDASPRVNQPTFINKEIKGPPPQPPPPPAPPPAPAPAPDPPSVEVPASVTTPESPYLVDVTKRPPVRLKPQNTFTLPISNLSAYKNYTVMVDCKRVNGNGKFGAKLTCQSGKLRYNRNFVLRQKSVKFSVPTGEPPIVGPQYQLIFYRPDKISIGEILIERVRILKPSSEMKVPPPRVSPNLPIRRNNPPPPEPVNIRSVATNKDISGNWHLPIPKIAHFYWGGRFPFLRYVSLLSFLKQNPDWKVKLHVPKVFGTIRPTWSTNEQSKAATAQKTRDYMDLAKKLNLEVVTHDFKDYGFPNNAHEVHKSDFLRWILLSNDGGVWCDSDIIFHRPLCLMTDNIPKNSGKNTGICRYDAKGKFARDSHAIGFLMASKNNLYYANVMNMAKRSFKDKRYQVIGAELLNKKFGALSRSSKSSCKFLDINPNTVYSITHIPKFISDKTYIQDYPEAIGFHWYGGHPSVSKIEYELNESNYHQHSSFIAKLVQFTLSY